MSRQRFIYPEIWRSEQFLALSMQARLLFIGIFSTADDHGRHKASALSLKVEVFPGDAVSAAQVTEWRDEIAAQGMIRVYGDDAGTEILDIPSWAKFQKPRHVSESRLAEYPGSGQIDIVPADPRRTPGETPSTPGGPPADDGSGVVWCREEKSGVESARSGAPVGQRAGTDAAKDIEAFAAQTVPGDADAALSEGGGTDAPATNDTPEAHDTATDALSEADDHKAVSVAWKEFIRLTAGLNGYDSNHGRDKTKALALARGLIRMDYAGRVLALSHAVDASGSDPPRGWPHIRLALRNEWDVSDPKSRVQAKQILDGM